MRIMIKLHGFSAIPVRWSFELDGLADVVVRTPDPGTNARLRFCRLAQTVTLLFERPLREDEMSPELLAVYAGGERRIRKYDEVVLSMAQALRMDIMFIRYGPVFETLNDFIDSLTDHDEAHLAEYRLAHEADTEY
jgi:hypothetical protein